MSNTRFLLTNRAETATVKNGSGGGAPARDETSPFTMERALNADRRSLWKSSSGVSSVLFDIDLGAAYSISVGALLGFTPLSAGGFVGFDLSYAATYYPAGWTLAGTTSSVAGDRDLGAILASVSARYWRFAITLSASPNISVGRVFLGSYSSGGHDLGGIHSPGGISAPFQNRLEQVMDDGSSNINALGFPGRDFTFPFNMVTATVRDKLMAIAAATGSVVLVDAEDKAYEVLVTGGRCNVARNTDSLFNVVLECRRLP